MATGKKAVKEKAAPAERKKPGPPAVAQDKLSAAGTEAICSHVIDGMSYREMAALYGVGLATLVTWMEADPERSHACARAREASSQSYDELALEGIKNAKDVFELSKAKEEAIHYRWRAKAVNPKRYGDKMAVGGADDLPPITQKYELSTDALLAIAAQAANK